jgi:thioredoxin reductase (NADPH)
MAAAQVSQELDDSGLRSNMENFNGTIRIYGRNAEPLGYMIRDFLHRSDIPFEWIDVTNNDEVLRQAGVASASDKRLPVCAFPDGTRLECPTIRQIVEKLGWFRNPSRAEYDVAIYGAGPAGLSAAVYAASEGLKTVLVERWAVGGQAGSSSHIENYLGFPKGIAGAELAERAREQVCKFGAEILIGREGVRGEFLPGKGVGYLADNTKIVARATVCATDVEYRRLNLSDEDRLLGAGVYYGAGASEAKLCHGGEDVFIVGGGNSAGQAAMHFSPVVRSVKMVVRGPSLKDTISQYLLDRISSAPNIEVLTESEVTALEGAQVLQAILVTNHKTGKSRRYETRWIFICIGGAPNTSWAEEVGIARDEGGYLLTGPDLPNGGRAPANWPLERHPYFLETSMPGVFAAGDVRHGSVKRCASAVGEGAMAITFVHRYLSNG